MAYNNIYDEICYKIDNYKSISHVRPNILYMGADRYEELFNYCQRVSLSREVVYEYDDNNEILSLSEIKDCEIRITLHGMLYVAYESSLNKKSKVRDCRKDKLIDKLFLSYIEERDIKNKITYELSEQIDNDLNDLHKFLEFEYYYDKWTEKKGGDK